MDFLYPDFKKATHQITGVDVIVSKDYPKDISFEKRKDYSDLEGYEVASIQENLGYQGGWTEIKVIDPRSEKYAYYNKSIYIKNDFLISINGKSYFNISYTKDHMPDPSAQEVDPRLKEVFTPYIDKKNGLLSVRIQTDYEKALDTYLFNTLLKEVYYEGLQILLASMGRESDNAAIDLLLSTYNTPAFINNDLDVTLQRKCEPLTFTVSMPLRYFDSIEAPTQPVKIGAVTKEVTLNNKTIRSEINKILSLFTSRADDITQVTYPNKFIQGFVIDFEIATMRRFLTVANEMFTIFGYSFIDESAIEYVIGLDDNLTINSVTIYKDGTSEKLENYQIAQLRLRAEFNSKRIFNYFLNYDQMVADHKALDIITYLKTYAKYPEISLVDEPVYVNGKKLPPQKVAEFRLAFNESKENCLKPSSIQRAINDTMDVGGSIYDIFISSEGEEKKKDNEKYLLDRLESMEDCLEGEPPDNSWGVKYILEPAKKALTPVTGVAQVTTDALVGVAEQLGESAKSFNINTVIYICNRLNLNKLIINRIFCLIKGTSLDDPDVKQLIQNIGPDIINYVNYYQQIKNLKGAAYLRALNNGLKLDYNLFCINDPGLTYLARGLSAISKTLNFAGKIKSTFKPGGQLDAILNKKTQSPYENFSKQLSKSLYQGLLTLVFDTVRDALTQSCEDGLFNPENNYANPFESKPTALGGGTANSNSDKQVLKANRSEALGFFYNPKEYGFDKEYTVDLLGLLFNDINCILTPAEVVDLLKGEPSSFALTLVKNIIKSKYYSGENDLSFLLSDPDKLVLFFKQIGATVDPDILVKITTIVNNPITPTNICSNEELLARKELHEGKVPRNLGTLDSQLKKKVSKAKTLFEKLQNGYGPIDVSPFCGDSDGNNEATDYLVQNYANSLDATFSDILTTFNDESDNLIESFAKNKTLIRQKSSGETIGSVEYTLYNEDLGLNVDYPVTIRPGNEIDKHRLIYYPYSQNDTTSKELSNSFLGANDQLQEANIVCTASEFVYNSEFKAFLDENKDKTRIWLESIEANRAFDDNGSSSSLHDLWSNGSRLGAHLKTLDYFIAITINSNIINSNEVEVKFIYVDKENARFVILKGFKLAKDISQKKSEVLGAAIYSQTSAYDLLYSSTVVPVLESKFAKLDLDTKNLLQQIYLEKFKPLISKIKNYEKIVSNVRKFRQSGIFSLDTKISSDISRTLNITTSNKDNVVAVNRLFNIKTQKVSNTLPPSEYAILQEIVLNNFAGSEYFKTDYDLTKDFIYYKTEDGLIDKFIDWIDGEETAIEKMQDSDYSVTKNVDISTNSYLRLYSRLKKYHLLVNPKYKNCNINPNYLNYDYFKIRELNNFKIDICEKGADPTKSMERILFNLIVRSFVTDYMVKTIPFWASYTRDEIKEVHKNNIFIDIFVEFLKLDTRKYSSNENVDQNDNTNPLFNKLLEVGGKIYVEYQTAIFKDLVFPKTNKNEEALQYYIRREIKRFVDFSLANDTISFTDTSFWDKMIAQPEAFEAETKSDLQKAIDFTADLTTTYTGVKFVAETLNRIFSSKTKKSRPTRKQSFIVDTQADSLKVHVRYGDGKEIPYTYPLTETRKIIEDERSHLLIYFLMSTNIDVQTEHIYSGAKSRLLEILGRYTVASTGSSEVGYNTIPPDQNQIEQFLSKVALSPVPYAMIGLNPQYTKYIKFFINAMVDTARMMTLNQAQNNDINIGLTRKINELVTLGGVLGWSIIDPQDRKDIIKNSNTYADLLFYKRLDDGKSVLPDLVTSLGITGGSFGALTPTPVGWTYLALDSIQEYKYYADSLEEIRKLKALEPGGDPCLPAQEAEAKAQTSPVCTPDLQKEAVKDIDKFEPEESK
jgi:hypothetical protein